MPACRSHKMMKKLQNLLLLLCVCLLTGCHYNNPDVLSPDDFITETAETISLSNAYYKLSEKYRQLYLKLQFDIYIPTDMKVYDSGDNTGIVILSDSAGKNFITLETRQKSDYEIVYREYLNTVTSGIGDRDNIKTYDDISVTAHQNGNPIALQAKRFDIKVLETLQNHDKKCISYWFIGFDGIEENEKTIIPKTTFVIMTETFIPEGSNDFSNVDIMQNIVTTVDLTAFLGNAS